MKNFFLVLIIFLAMSCREEIVNDPPIDLLYLKSASADEERIVYSTRTETYQFPNNILFKIPASRNEVVILNNSSLIVKDYKLIFPDQAMFTVNENDSSMTVKAEKLPFYPEDYAPQTESGDTRFNGILKSKNFVFSVNGKDIKILDLQTNFLTTTIASISNDSYNFKVGTEILKLRLSKISPENGNIFQLFVPYDEGANDITYTLLK